MDYDLESECQEEVKEIEETLHEFNSLCADYGKLSSSHTAVKAFNGIHTADALFPVLAFENEVLIAMNKNSMDFH